MAHQRQSGTDPQHIARQRLIRTEFLSKDWYADFNLQGQEWHTASEQFTMECLLDSLFTICRILKFLTGNLVQEVSQPLFDDVIGDLVPLSTA